MSKDRHHFPEEVRVTPALRSVARVFVMDPTAELFLSEIGRNSGFQAGTVCPILKRFLNAGWIEITRLKGDTPRARKFYRVTPDGEVMLSAIAWS